jgi:hypothetical protein
MHACKFLDTKYTEHQIQQGSQVHIFSQNMAWGNKGLSGHMRTYFLQKMQAERFFFKNY